MYHTVSYAISMQNTQRIHREYAEYIVSCVLYNKDKYPIQNDILHT